MDVRDHDVESVGGEPVRDGGSDSGTGGGGDEGDLA